MSLTNRLSIYFLAAIGVVLAGFSLVTFLIVRGHLSAQLDHRLDAMTHALVSAIEIHPGDVEWEPLERKIKIGEDPSLEQPRWAVRNITGTLIDCSPNLEDDSVGSARATSQWRAKSCLLLSGQFNPQPQDNPDNLVPEKIQLPKDRTFHGDGLWLTAAVSERPMLESLTNLALTLAAVSSFIWLTAAFWGRWLCKQALQPISRMAKSARTIRRESSQETELDVATTGDELEDLGVAFNELLANLRESLDRQQRFTGDASHQLRTPLSALLAAVDVALRQERNPAEYQRVLGVVRRRGGQLTQIIETLLFLARPDHASALSEPECVNLADWCRSWLDGWQDHPRATEIVFQPDAEPTAVRTYPSLLGQVLDNLLDNACKYSEPGTPVVVTLASVDGNVTLSVTDEGCGIDEADRERVFEPFFRSSQARWLGKPGVGLGLTVARRLVAILAGKLEMTSEIGQGSRFFITFPLDLSLVDCRQLGMNSEIGWSAVEPESVKPVNDLGVNKLRSHSADSTTSDARPGAVVVNLEGMQ